VLLYKEADRTISHLLLDIFILVKHMEPYSEGFCDNVFIKNIKDTIVDFSLLSRVLNCLIIVSVSVSLGQ